MAEVPTTENQVTTEESSEATENEQASKPEGDVPPEVKAALRKANKEAETLRLRLKEFEDRDKTEAQKLEERVSAAEKRAADMEIAALRLEIAGEKGLNPAQAKRLVGSTRDELEADAAELLATFKSTAEAKQEQAAASLDLGSRGSGATATADQAAANWLQSIARR